MPKRSSDDFDLDSTDELPVLLRAVMRGETYLSPAISKQVVDGYLGRTAAPAAPGDGAALDVLTSRQREILQLVADPQRRGSHLVGPPRWRYRRRSRRRSRRFIPASDIGDAVRTAVVNKRAGGSGLISGRKAFQRPIAEGAKLLHTIQDVYLCPEVSIA